MIVATPKEIKDHEYRVGMVPAGVQADMGVQAASLNDLALLKGFNVIDGCVVCPPVARELGYEAQDASTVLASVR